MNLRPQPAPSASSLAGQVTSARVHVDVEVPRTTVRGKMRVLGYGEECMVEAETRIALREFGITDEGHRRFREEIAMRTVAAAVRDPADTSQTLASVEAWKECDAGQIGELWQRYKDLADQLDPIGGNVTSEDLQAMEAAAKKGEAGLLMSYGSSKLAGFAITLAGRPAT